MSKSTGIEYDWHHAAADEAGEWAINQQRMEALRMGDQRRREQEAERIRQAFNAGKLCTGDCENGTRDCTCGGALVDMACAAPEEPPRWWQRLLARLGGKQ